MSLPLLANQRPAAALRKPQALSYLEDAGFEPARFELNLSTLYPTLNHADSLGKRLCLSSPSHR